MSFHNSLVHFDLLQFFSLFQSSSETVLNTTSVLQRIHSLSSSDQQVSQIANAPSQSTNVPLHRNKSSLHGGSSAWSTTNQTTNIGGSLSSLNQSNSLPSPLVLHNTPDFGDPHMPGKVVNHGKPNVAPKPPGIAVSPNGQPNNNNNNNGKPSPPMKKLNMNGKPASRAQSMRVPRYGNFIAFTLIL